MSFDNFRGDASMNINKRWAFLLAATAGVVGGAVLAVASRRQHHEVARELEHTSELKSWENEGGNVAPAGIAPAQP
jgi:hypothetical protein